MRHGNGPSASYCILAEYELRTAPKGWVGLVMPSASVCAMAKVNYLSMFSSEKLGKKERWPPPKHDGTLPQVNGKEAVGPALHVQHQLHTKNTASSRGSQAHSSSRSIRERAVSKDGVLVVGLSRRPMVTPTARRRTTTWPEAEECYQTWLDITNLPVSEELSREPTLRTRTVDPLGGGGSLYGAGRVREKVPGTGTAPVLGGQETRSPTLKTRPKSKPSGDHFPPLAVRDTHLQSNSGVLQPRTPHTVSRMGRNSLQVYTYLVPHKDRPLLKSISSLAGVTRSDPLLKLRTLVRTGERACCSPKQVSKSCSFATDIERLSDISPPPSPPYLTPACTAVSYTCGNK